MASIDETAASTVTAGALPDSVQVDPRLWQFSPLRVRDPASPDFTNAGIDVNLFGDPDDDGDAVTVAALGAGIRNGAKRALDPEGDMALWAEPSPRRYDVWSAVSNGLGLSAPISGADSEFLLGVAALADVVAADGFPLVVTPVVDIDSALIERSIASTSLQAITTTATLTATVTPGVGDPVETVGVRDLFHGEGGSLSLVLDAVTIAAAATYELRCDLGIRYRREVTAVVPINIVGLRVGLQVVEFTSLGA
jgi:hypothetical protein